MNQDFDKEFFTRSWGASGYYENFSYGVGIEKVCQVALYPFLNRSVDALEIGSGGGVFTERIVEQVKSITAVDVIEKPERFEKWLNLRYIELPDQSTSLPGIDESFHFAWCYNVFCHFSNEMIRSYVESVYRVLRHGGNFIFMLAKYAETKKHFETEFDLGELTTVGHFAQDYRTVDLVVGKEWVIVSRDMIPEHRDIIVHLKKP